MNEGSCNRRNEDYGSEESDSRLQERKLEEIERHVELELGERAIFTEADPILLRLAIRNLLDNALKHSQLGRKVKLHVGVDEALMRVAITVTNWPATEFAPDPALFERGVRGKQAAPENKGLGLFIVSEVAVLHHGEVQNRVDEHGCTEFKLLLPA